MGLREQLVDARSQRPEVLDPLERERALPNPSKTAVRTAVHPLDEPGTDIGSPDADRYLPLRRGTPGVEVVRRVGAGLLASPLLPVAVFLGMSAYLVAFELRRFWAGVPAYDAGYFSQAAWLISHGRSPVVTVRGIHLLGDHAYFGFYPVALLTRLGNPTVVLFVVQALAIAAAVFPLAAFCRRVAGLGSAGTAVVLVAYAFFPAAHNINAADFHPESLAVPFLIGACLAAGTRRWWLLAACAVVVYSLREDLAVSLAVLGLVLFFTASRRAGAALAAVSGVVYLLDTKVLIPHFAGGAYVQEGQLSRYGGSLAGLLKTIVLHPYTAAVDLWSPQNALLVLALLAPVAFLPLAGMRWLLPAVPVQVALLFTDRAAAHTINAQYVTQAIPFVLVAAAAGLGRLGGDLPAVTRRLGPVVVIAGLLSWATLALDIPGQPWKANLPRAEAMKAATAQVPSGAGVTATSGAWVRLAERTALYPYPQTDSSFFVPGTPRTPDTACWAVVATDDPMYLQALPGAGWYVVFHQDVYEVLRRC